MTKFEMINTVFTGISVLTAMIAVYLQAQNQKKDSNENREADSRESYTLEESLPSPRDGQ